MTNTNLSTKESNFGNDVQAITTLEIAEMMDMEHGKLLRKIEGSTDRKGYVQIIAEAQMGVSEYFLPSTYKDASGKGNKCYLVTKLGCDFLANKFTGEKGILFTAKYVKRFHEMEDMLKPKMPTTYLEALKELVAKEEENQKLLADNSSLHKEIGVKNQIIGELKPKADYTDLILKSKGTVTITQIAEDYGMSGRKLNKILQELGVQYKESGQWLLYRKYQDKGYTHSETIDITLSDGRQDVRMNTKWLQKGRLFLYNLLKENGYLPMIEQDMAS